jgi:(p)ppGpp synthase/HD superfamily hydrolase
MGILKRAQQDMPAKAPLKTTTLKPLSIRFDHALLFAAQVHRNQDRKKSGIPYLSHLMGVAAIVLDYGGDEDMGIAALLHDAAEDHGGRAMLNSIELMFGKRVAKIVDGCTDSYGDEGKRKPKWYPRKMRYIRRVRNEDAETRFVSAADKLYNARAILRDVRQVGDSAFVRFAAPKAKVLWYYRALVTAFRAGGVTHLLKPLLDDLDRVVTELEHLALVEAAAEVSPKGKLKMRK